MRRHPRHCFFAGLALIAAVFMTGVGAIFTVGLYDRLTLVEPDCGGRNLGQSPAQFEAPVDSTPYLMREFERVRFPSRDAAITIDAWWVPGPTGDAPAVVLAHGLHECKRSSTVLFPAGMLHRHGFAVLLIDLRDQGASTVDTGRFAGGVGEARDLLGAWDWLRTEKGLPASGIGLFGVSLGAGAVMLAGGQERGVAAVWEDSGYANLTEVLRHQVGSYFIPTVFADLALTYGRMQGVEITSPSPAEALARFGSRPLAVVHGELDRQVPVEQARRLASIDRAAGGSPTVWILPGVGHVSAMTRMPAEYETRLAAFFAAALSVT